LGTPCRSPTGEPSRTKAPGGPVAIRQISFVLALAVGGKHGHEQGDA